MPVTGNNDLFVSFFQRVERMEKFFLGPFLIFQKLDIIDNQAVDSTLFFLKVFNRMVLDSINNFIGKGFAGYIFYFCVWSRSQNRISDSVH